MALRRLSIPVPIYFKKFATSRNVKKYGDILLKTV